MEAANPLGDFEVTLLNHGLEIYLGEPYFPLTFDLWQPQDLAESPTALPSNISPFGKGIPLCCRTWEDNWEAISAWTQEDIPFLIRAIEATRLSYKAGT